MTKTIHVDIDWEYPERNDGINDILLPRIDLIPSESKKKLKEAADVLAAGNVVAIPTETVYGLAANAYSDAAVKKIFHVKGRPSDNPLIVHISNLSMLAALLDKTSHSARKVYTENEVKALIPEQYHEVIQRYWPGSLTILIPTSSKIPSAVTAGQKTLAVRFPSHPVARALIDLCGFPLAAPSANRSGRPSPTMASHVLDDLQDLLPLVVDGGACKSGVESTVLDAMRSPPAILRPGGVCVEDIQKLSGFENTLVYKRDFKDAVLEHRPTTPGMKYRHYTPEADVIVFENFSNSAQLRDHSDLFSSNEKLGFMGSSEFIESCKALSSDSHEVFPIDTEASSFAHLLFKGLRDLELKKVSVIVAQGIPEDREGLAVMNRLRKSAAKIIYL